MPLLVFGVLRQGGEGGERGTIPEVYFSIGVMLALQRHSLRSGVR